MESKTGNGGPNIADIMASDGSLGGDGQPMSASGIKTTGLPTGSCNNQAVMNPNDLLPTDNNSEWAKLNPADNTLKSMNFMKAGQHMGINSIGSTLRNPNLQLRSEPTNPQMETGPWNNTTMEGDPLRRSLEIGNE